MQLAPRARRPHDDTWMFLGFVRKKTALARGINEEKSSDQPPAASHIYVYGYVPTAMLPDSGPSTNFGSGGTWAFISFIAFTNLAIA